MPRSLLAVLALAACSSASPSVSQTPAKAPIDPAMCTHLASSQHQHCGSDEKQATDQCMAYARLAEAASCAGPAQRSFECGLSKIGNCNGSDCCQKNLSQCDDIDLPFDHCMRGYCSGQPGNPDCVWFPPK